ncbi:hypothetical protein SDC9_154784 [bioreactor metagenome]|uniref:Uncharacterized protein n=1 Tax=bioreactor metagenome TaxID=1076179 RepID=A0A645F4H5_9ZZZZ
MAKLPICHSVILSKSSVKNAINVVNKAFTNKENTIPAKIIVLFDMVLSILDAKIITINTVAKPEINPTKGRVNPCKNGIDIPETITNPAPRDAPEDTPSVYGDASSFFSTD